MTTTNSSKAAGVESKKFEYNINTYKEYWKNTELVPSSKPDTQLPFLIKTLKEGLDISKIESVLEVGVGYGRVAKAILDEFPVVDLYDGLDISEYALNQSVEYLGEHIVLNKHIGYCPYPADDFLEAAIPEMYDLVISVETMSVIPDEETVRKWIDKMCKLSKKYVVNLDYSRTTDPITNIKHNYHEIYEDRYECNEVIDYGAFIIRNNENEGIWIARVR